MAADPIDDYITLGGQNFAVKGFAQGNSLAEFETGLKIGPANYDNRENAFYLVLNDFSAGFGERRLDIRDKLGTFWYQNPANAAETSFAGRLTLPLAQTFYPITTKPKRVVPGEVSYPYCRLPASGHWLFGLGNAIYDIGSAGSDPTQRYVPATATNGQRITSIPGLGAKPEGTYRNYASFADGYYPLLSTDSGVNWTQPTQKWLPKQPADSTSVLTINHVVKKYTIASTTWTTLYTTYNGGWRPLTIWKGYTSGDLITGQLHQNDLFYWDKKLLGCYGADVTFLVPRSGSWNHEEAIAWSSDDSGYATDSTVVAESHTSGTTVAISGTIGEEPWNKQLSDIDGEFIAWPESLDNAWFIGSADGPTGEPQVYMRAGRKLHVLDFYARRMIPIEIGAAGSLITGCLHQGQVAVSDGWNVYLYAPRGNSVRNIGFPKKPGFGIPPNMLGKSSGVQQVAYIFSSDDYLMAVVTDTSDSSHPATTLYRHNGLGWHQVGAQMTDFLGYYGFQAFFGGATIAQATTRYIIIPGVAGAVTDNTTDLTSVSVGYYQFTLPNLTHQSTVGLDTFGASGASFITGWIDGGFLDISGTLLRLNIDAWSLTSTETVKIEYQLDNNEAGSWTQMVDSSNNAAVFDDTHSVLYFSQASPKAGVQFRTVRFRISLNRGSTATLSPEVRALTLVYIKIPPLRTSWTFQVDCNRMIEQSKTGGNTTFQVDGVAATLPLIWNKLKTLWNTHTLLPMTIPNVQPSPGILVRISDMPMTFDDFRDAVTGQGSVQLQVLEPVVDAS